MKQKGVYCVVTFCLILHCSLNFTYNMIRCVHYVLCILYMCMYTVMVYTRKFTGVWTLIFMTPLRIECYVTNLGIHMYEYMYVQNFLVMFFWNDNCINSMEFVLCLVFSTYMYMCTQFYGEIRVILEV